MTQAQTIEETLKDLLAAVTGMSKVRDVQKRIKTEHGEHAMHVVNLLVQAKMLAIRVLRPGNGLDKLDAMMMKDYIYTSSAAMLEGFPKELRSVLTGYADQMLNVVGESIKAEKEAKKEETCDGNCESCDAHTDLADAMAFATGARLRH